MANPSSAAAATLPEDPLLQLLREGAFRDAILMVHREHGASIGRLCMAMLGNQAEAEDCLQETLVIAYRAFANYRSEGTVRAWVFGIARRVCAKRMESVQRRQKHLRLVTPEPSPTSPDVSTELKERARVVRVALEKLKPSLREAVLLRYESGLEYNEIAHALELDEAAARKRVSRGLLHLRELLIPGGVR